METFLPLLLIPVIGYFGYACGRSHGWAGCLVFLAALVVVAIAVLVTKVGDGTGQTAPLPTLVVIALSCVLATVSGAFGVAKRRRALQSAGTKTPKSG